MGNATQYRTVIRRRGWGGDSKSTTYFVLDDGAIRCGKGQLDDGEMIEILRRGHAAGKSEDQGLTADCQWSYERIARCEVRATEHGLAAYSGRLEICGVR
jgi:hypothetical protein